MIGLALLYILICAAIYLIVLGGGTILIAIVGKFLNWFLNN